MSRYGNLMAPSLSHHSHNTSQRSSSGSGPGPIGARTSLSSSSRDDVTPQRYFLSHPDGVQPLTDHTTSQNQRKSLAPLLSVNTDVSLVLYPDFFPWRKTAAEDDIVIKNLHKGFSLAPRFVDESLSARTTMTSTLQQRPSLLALSYLMTNAMKVHERAHRFTSSSTFKPPPRVTLTEQKKEAWLRDLANPAIPLRRLSRTIPHGTRNRSLLEQCCNKNVPISRAVWFARCVGANELRGLKRKGAAVAQGGNQASEAAWIREWTEQVTEYIEKIIKDFPLKNGKPPPNAITSAASPNDSSSPRILNYSSPSPSAQPNTKPPQQSTGASPSASSPSASSPLIQNSSIRSTTSFTSLKQPQQHFSTAWKTKLEYMLRLSEYLFAEDLLDKPFFLRWCISYFETCKIQELPSALLFLRPFSHSIIRSTALSRTLALALLKHYATIAKTPELAHQSVGIYLCTQISEYVKTLIILSPDVFVIPTHWKTLGPVLSQLLKAYISSSPASLLANGRELDELYASISTRNENLIISDSSHVRSLRNPHFLVIDALDRASLPFDWHQITQIVLNNNIPERDALLTTFEWATTTSRIGLGRLYACLSLMSFWRAAPHEWDVSGAFMEFLSSIKDPSDYDMRNTYDLITEFLDRDWFCISTYLRKLISSGVLFIPRLRGSVQGQIQIVANLPTQFFSNDIRNQQIMLLQSANIYDDTETSRLQDLSQRMIQHLDFLAPDYTTDDRHDLEYNELPSTVCDEITSLTRGSQIELSMWLVRLLIDQLEREYLPTISQFSLLQNAFEVLRDPKSLYRVIEAIVPRITPLSTTHHSQSNNGPTAMPDSLADSASTYLGFLATSIRDNLFSFSAVADVNQIILLLVLQYKSLKTNRSMPRGLWDLVQYAWYCMRTVYSNKAPQDCPAVNIELRSELEDLLKPGGPAPVPLPVTGTTPMAISTLSPIADLIPESILTQEINALLRDGDGDPLHIPVALDAQSVPRYFSIVATKFIEACGFTPESDKPSNQTDIRRFAKLLQRLRETDVAAFNSVLPRFLIEKTEVSLKQTLPTSLAYSPLVLKRVFLFLIIYDCVSFVFLADMFYPKQLLLDFQYSQALQQYHQQYAQAHGPAAATQSALHHIHQQHQQQLASQSQSQSQSQTQTLDADDSQLKPPMRPEVNYVQILLELISLKFVDDAEISLKASEKLALNMHRHIFQRTSPVLYSKCIVHEILNSTTPDTTLPEKEATAQRPKQVLDDAHPCFAEVSSFLLWLSIADVQKFIEFFTEPIVSSGNQWAIEVSNVITASLLKTEPTQASVAIVNGYKSGENGASIADVASEIVKLMGICNDFNIHLCQAHLRTVLHILHARPATSKPYPPQSQQQQKEELYEFAVQQILQLVTVDTHRLASTRPRTLGDILIHLSSAFKSKLLYRAELVFFQKLETLLGEQKGESDSPLAYLFEIIDAIADSAQTNTLSVNRPEFVDFLDHIVNITEAYQATESRPNEPDLRRAILLLGKIVMIHSASLPTAEACRAITSCIVTALLRLLGTRFVRHETKDLYGFLLDVYNTVKGLVGSGFAEEDESTATPGASAAASTDRRVYSRQGSIVGSPINFSSSGASSQQPPQGQQKYSDYHLLGQKPKYGSPIDNTSTTPGGVPMSAGSSSAAGSSHAPSRNMSVSLSAGNAASTAAAAAADDDQQLALDALDGAQTRPPDKGVYALERQHQHQALVQRLRADETTTHDTYLADLVLYHRAANRCTEMNVRAFDLLEDSNPKMQANDVAINLALFDGIVEKSNPKVL